ncbi:NAD(P)H-dependent oxidoreductase [Staphylococcus sp. 17KM0847]|uniref:NAD(P)H-dependent oxidoreductase n=1 Tax=Staphylococcus sp. 17KM0847 TaxID=2583989 RepID=UPI0015DD1F76|nr:NAD(P)H-dependent oxidoreductase [Staphylococcus sp. 17KM0847]QLK85399.1 NAD(P)H-dependent oxidoreductase [Staphylococcus sp. 17KM0847]
MITVLFGGCQEQENTVALTEQVLRGHDYRWLNLEKIVDNASLRDKQISDMTYQDNTVCQQAVSQVLESHTVLLVSPVCWYSMSASLHEFIGMWSEALESPSFQSAKERMADINFRLILIGEDSPRIKALPCVQQVEYSLQSLGGHLQDYLIGCVEEAGDIFKDSYAIKEATRWNEQYTLDAVGEAK